MSACPCGLGPPYDECCGRFHRAEASAPTAQALMRSRFSAYARGDVAYLRRTWHASTRPKRLELDPRLQWVRLEILGHTGGSLFDHEGTVRFDAHYRDGDRPGVLSESSRFVREHGKWLYLAGDSP
jgi:SEC-C motif-containing protein